MAVRVQHVDLVLVAGAQGSRLDPSAVNGISAKLGFDATVPLTKEASAFKRIHVPGRVVNLVV